MYQHTWIFLENIIGLHQKKLLSSNTFLASALPSSCSAQPVTCDLHPAIISPGPWRREGAYLGANLATDAFTKNVPDCVIACVHTRACCHEVVLLSEILVWVFFVVFLCLDMTLNWTELCPKLFNLHFYCAVPVECSDVFSGHRSSRQWSLGPLFVTIVFLKQLSDLPT